MSLIAHRNWILTLTVTWMIGLVKLQFPYPMMPMMGMPPPMMAMPPPMAMPLPMAIPIPMPIDVMKDPSQHSPDQSPIMTTTTTTTTTTENTNLYNNPINGFGMHFPIPFPVPVSISMQIPHSPSIPNYGDNRPQPPSRQPQCPPCTCQPCTPAYFSFCSPCHRKCRCPKSEDRCSQSESDPESDSCESSERGRKRRSQRKYRERRSDYRRTSRHYDLDSDKSFAKPVLSYISNDGDVKINKHLSEYDAAELLNDNSEMQTVQVISQKDLDDHQTIVVKTTRDSDVSEPKPRKKSRPLNRIPVMSAATEYKIKGDGKKRLVFRPPNNKKISNVSVSFQVS